MPLETKTLTFETFKNVLTSNVPLDSTHKYSTIGNFLSLKVLFWMHAMFLDLNYTEMGDLATEVDLGSMLSKGIR